MFVRAPRTVQPAATATTISPARASDRVLFIDLARACAVVFMVQGHVFQVLLRPDYAGSTLFETWLYFRGLTSCAFLMLAGFSFSLATARYWPQYLTLGGRTRRRLTRFAVFLAIGYAMRIPIRPLSGIARLTPEQWRSFATVDVLQLVAVTLAGLHGLVWLARTPRRLGLVSLIGAVAVVFLTPFAWTADWTHGLPLFVASYLSPATGSIFPLFPWAAYILFGTALGAWFSLRQKDAVDQATAAFVLLGVCMFVAGLLLHHVPIAPYGDIDFWKISPNLFLVKAGSVLVLLSATARLTRARARLPHIVSSLSRESLTIYFVHVCLLYGSIWNTGLLQAIGPRLDLAACLGWIAGVMVSMCVLAVAWDECKRRSENVSGLIRAGVTAVLAYSVM